MAAGERGNHLVSWIQCLARYDDRREFFDGKIAELRGILHYLGDHNRAAGRSLELLW
jgi:hypothetical protein